MVTLFLQILITENGGFIISKIYKHLAFALWSNYTMFEYYKTYFLSLNKLCHCHCHHMFYLLLVVITFPPLCNLTPCCSYAHCSRGVVRPVPVWPQCEDYQGQSSCMFVIEGLCLPRAEVRRRRARGKGGPDLLLHDILKRERNVPRPFWVWYPPVCKKNH